MHEKVKKFLDEKKAEEQLERSEFLIEQGLFEKEYGSYNISSYEYPYWEEDPETNESRYYKKVAIPVTDEEFKEIEKYTGVSAKNSIASVLKAIAVLTYLGGLILGFQAGLDMAEDSSFSLIHAIDAWGTAFVEGTLLLAFSEVIRLLNDIKNK